MTVKLAFLYNSLRTEGRSELIIKVSVIIPVYNAESFLRPCLNSVISQNYKDSEIILIENGSEDGSRTICEEYAERFENIRIITETQRGTAMARQRGLDVCKGEAVVFVDADDVLPSPDVFSKMAECLEKTKADIVCGEYSRLWEGKLLPVKSVKAFSDNPRESEAFWFYAFFSCGNLSYVWGKMYRISFLKEKQIRFCKYRYSEDKLFNLTCYAREASYAFLFEQVYIYRKNNASLSYQYRGDSVENWIGIVRETEAVWRAEEKKEQENLVGYLIVFAAAFDAIMNEQYPEGKYGSARNLLQRYGEDEYCRPWFCKMAGRKQTKEIPSVLWRCMIRGFSFCMKVRWYGLLSFGMKLMVRLHLTETLSDTGRRG